MEWWDQRPNAYNRQYTNGEILTTHIVVIILLLAIGICGSIGG